MIVLILILGLVLRCIGLNQSFWLDEAAQVIESARPLGQQLNIAGDFQPPLFHILLHFWMMVSHAEVWIRLLPVTIGIFTIYGIYLFAKEVTGGKTPLLTAFLLSIAPFHIWYSQEVRPYALSVLLGVLATYFLFKKHWWLYALCALLFIYSTYTAVFLLMTHGAYEWFFEKKQLKAFLGAILVVFIGFLPWLPFFKEQLAIGTGLTTTLPGWSDAVSTPLSKALPLVFTKFMLGRITIDNKPLYAGVIGGLFLLGLALFIVAVKKEKQLTLRISFLTLAPILLAFLVSFLIPVLAPQRVLFVLPFFYLVLAIGISSSKKHALFLLPLLLISFYSLFLYYTNPQFQREQWRQAVTFVEANSPSPALAIFIFPDAFAPWQWYAHGTVPFVAVAPHFTVVQTELVQYRERIALVNRIYEFHYLEELTDPTHLVPLFLNNLGFRETQKQDFPGVGFISIYEKTVAYN